MIQEILVIQQANRDQWECSPSVIIAGNQSIEDILLRIDSGLGENKHPANFGIWKGQGKRYDLSNTLLEECNRWELNDYEIVTGNPESRYQTIVILYYSPVLQLLVMA